MAVTDVNENGVGTVGPTVDLMHLPADMALLGMFAMFDDLVPDIGWDHDLRDA